jgi:hypothetical protein
LIRASINPLKRFQKMDCRVEPGNDGLLDGLRRWSIPLACRRILRGFPVAREEALHGDKKHRHH